MLASSPQKMDANNGNLRASDNHYELYPSIKKKMTSPVTGEVIFVLQTLNKVHPPPGDRQYDASFRAQEWG